MGNDVVVVVSFFVKGVSIMRVNYNALIRAAANLQSPSGIPLRSSSFDERGPANEPLRTF